MAAPARERWNHDNHYHERLLRSLPAWFDRALDVGWTPFGSASAATTEVEG